MRRSSASSSRSTRACSRSCRRWASQRISLIAGPRSSTLSGYPAPLSTSSSSALRPRSRALDWPISPPRRHAVTPMRSASRRSCAPRWMSGANTPFACAAKRTAGRLRQYRCCNTPCAATRVTAMTPSPRRSTNRASSCSRSAASSASRRRRPRVALPSRSQKSSLRRKSSSAFRRARCPSARSRARRTPPSPSP